VLPVLLAEDVVLVLIEELAVAAVSVTETTMVMRKLDDCWVAEL